MKLAAVAALAGSATAFPGLANHGLNKKGLLNLGGDGKLLDLSSLSNVSGLSDLVKLSDKSPTDFNEERAKDDDFPFADPKNCPFNPDHKPAAKWNEKFPYNYAKNGLPGKGKGGYLVPAPGDEDHKYIAPGKNDIRGPCPGMNMLANHGFIARDGITNFAESVDACQNVFNMDWELSTIITLIATVLGDGDVLSQRFSIGCDATDRTASVKLLSGAQPGLNGHGNFEVDASMSRNDYFLNEGDDATLNPKLFAQMVEQSGGEFTQSHISKMKHTRWHQSQKENPNFFFGPIGLISYAAAAFLPELYGTGDSADLHTIATFFGVGQGADGSWTYGHNESIPENWYAREKPYGVVGVVNNFLKMYLENPVLFGGNTANGTFMGLNFGAIKDGKISEDISVNDTLCLIYQILLFPLPGLANGILDIGKDALHLVTSTLGDTLSNLGCPAPVNAG